MGDKYGASQNKRRLEKGVTMDASCLALAEGENCLPVQGSSFVLCNHLDAGLASMLESRFALDTLWQEVEAVLLVLQ